MPILTNRAIIEETPLYFLFSPDNIISPGFLELVPKRVGHKKVWTTRVWNHLKAFSDPLNITGLKPDAAGQISYVPTHRFSFSYQQGQVAVYPNEGRVEIQATHPNRNVVVDGLLKLFFDLDASLPRPTQQQRINIIVHSNN